MAKSTAVQGNCWVCPSATLAGSTGWEKASPSPARCQCPQDGQHSTRVSWEKIHFCTLTQSKIRLHSSPPLWGHSRASHHSCDVPPCPSLDAPSHLTSTHLHFRAGTYPVALLLNKSQLLVKSNTIPGRSCKHYSRGGLFLAGTKARGAGQESSSPRALGKERFMG